MNFSAIFGTPQSQEQFVINAPSWSACLAYCEGTGKQLYSIQLQSSINIIYNVEGTNCYLVSAKDSGGVSQTYFVWESSFDTLNNWVEAQEFSSIQLVQYANKSYVVV